MLRFKIVLRSPLKEEKAIAFEDQTLVQGEAIAFEYQTLVQGEAIIISVTYYLTKIKPGAQIGSVAFWVNSLRHLVYLGDHRSPRYA